MQQTPDQVLIGRQLVGEQGNIPLFRIAISICVCMMNAHLKRSLILDVEVL